MANALGLLFGTGLVGVAGWYGYQAVNVRNAYQSVTESDSETTSIVDGNEVTVEGEIVVDEPVTTPGSEPLVESVPRPALVVWRIRRGKRSKYDKKAGVSGDWTTVASGIDAGTFTVRTGGKEIRVDPTWLVHRHGGTTLRSLSPSDLDGSGLRSKEAWKTPYVHLAAAEESFELSERAALSSALHKHAENSGKTYLLELRALPESVPLTVNGQIAVEQGTTSIRGSDDVPMSLSDQGTAVLSSSLQNQMLKCAGYAVVLVVFAAIVFYASLEPTVL